MDEIISEIWDRLKKNYKSVDLSEKHIVFIVNNYFDIISELIKDGNKIDFPIIGKLSTEPKEGWSTYSNWVHEYVAVPESIKFVFEPSNSVKKETHKRLSEIYFNKSESSYSFDDIEDLEHD